MNWETDAIDVAREIQEIGSSLSRIDDTLELATHGATLRDMFAMAALTGYLANKEPLLVNDGTAIAKQAYVLADAMLTVREAKP